MSISQGSTAVHVAGHHKVNCETLFALVSYVAPTYLWRLEGPNDELSHSKKHYVRVPGRNESVPSKKKLKVTS